MNRANIGFFTEDIFYTIKSKTVLRAWLCSVIRSEGYELSELNFILCSDSYLLRMNQDFLQHDDYTDVITFDNAEEPQIVFGDIFISIDRIKENAKRFRATILQELCRVMVHGTLHLMGYKDKTKAAKSLMTSKEDYYLSQLSFAPQLSAAI